MARIRYPMFTKTDLFLKRSVKMYEMSSTRFRSFISHLRDSAWTNPWSVSARESLPLSPFPLLSLKNRIKDVTVPTAAIQQQQNFHTAENNNTKIKICIGMLQ